MYFTAGKKIDVLKFRIYYAVREKTGQIIEVPKLIPPIKSKKD